ncbi:MAG TPA: hypothetical protein VMF61_01245 [Candidatus Acidoferrales bacterium]|nr:hypothetical protein [Candidatus Acidoferrales bacterium]
MMYFQNYSSLCEYFTATGTSPADCVGGLWPEAGFTLPSNERRPLPAGREFQVSDASISLSPDVPVSDGSIASAYLDHFAAVYCALDRPEPEYHDWPHMAEQTILNLTYSDECRIEQRGRAYLAPYAGDKTKPPESMVQLTVLLPTYEYAAWSKTAVSFAEQIFRSLPSFFDAELNCFTRWPEGQCDPGPPDVRGSTRYADSWYIYHTLFNVARLVKRTHDTALRDLFRRSLGYARRVAHRFEYRFPVFFHLDTLEIFRAEAREGSGGENDVSGLYASVMLQAYDIFGEPEWLDEAERAADRLKGLGFNVGYQMNSTGFAADATLRLYFLTGRPEYLDLSYLCLANVLDNAWLWDCRYGNARAYSTFFGIFPLPDAPYLAAYEEMENSSKFREYLRIGGDDILPSVRLLLAEYCRHVLQRAWYYYPSNLPRQALAEHPKSGRIFADLAVPLEDLQEGWQKCGQVGQEIYGSGLAPALTVRHYAYLEALDCTLFCDYPAFGLRVSETTHPTIVKLSIAGDGRACCSIRVIPRDAARPAPSGTARVGRTTVSPTSTPQGHLLFRVPGGSTVRLLLSRR